MIEKHWEQLNEDCPIDLSRIKKYAQEFDSNIPNSITLDNLDECKESILSARGNFDSMITVLIQNLYNREILKEPEDKILFAWLVDNIGRYLKKLDDEEYSLIVKFDEPNKHNAVGISRISSYSKLLTTSMDSIIYETLLKSTIEYVNFKETNHLKREPRTFLYILFQIFQVTLSILGGLTREKTSQLSKKGVVNNIPTSWQSLMNDRGQERIKEGYKEDTGIDISEFEDDLDDSPDILIDMKEEEAEVEEEIKNEMDETNEPI